MILSCHASPYSAGKALRRLEIAQIQVRNSGLPLIYANQFGGQDELVFDGGSFVLDAAGALQCRLKAFAEDMVLTEWQKTAFGWAYKSGGVLEEQPAGEEADYTACMIGLRDYMGKNGFKKALVGLSGGVDSALCAAIAADAAGAENVSAMMLSYRWIIADKAEISGRSGSFSGRKREICAALIAAPLTVRCGIPVLPRKAMLFAAAVSAQFAAAVSPHLNAFICVS